MRPLDYNGRPMRAAPINGTLTQLAAMLRDGQPVVAELEPGDATYYALLITPCDALYVAPFLGRQGVPPREAYRWLHVAKLGDGQAFVRLDGEVLAYDLTGLTRNGWGQEFLAWWLNALREALGADVLVGTGG